MTKQRLIARCAVMSALLLAAGCQATSPVYQSYFVSISEGADEAARITAAQARCDAEAHVEAQGAYDNAYRRAEVSAPRYNEGSQGNAPSGLAMTPSQRSALMAAEVAAGQARAAYDATWATAKNACMASLGFREVTFCVSNCPDAVRNAPEPEPQEPRQN